MNEWINTKHWMPQEGEIVDIWVVPGRKHFRSGFRIPTVKWEWNGGTEGFWDWHYADDSDSRDGEPLQMYDIQRKNVKFWMPLPEPPEKA